MIQLNVIKTGGPSVSLPEMAEGELTLGIRPNPGSGEFTAELDYWNDGPLTIVIYSILGEEVYKINAFLTNGSLKQELKLDDLPPGTYYLKADNTQQSRGTRLVICR
jgi:hypothetical protein